MKKLLLVATCLVLFVGCNESKEARIQKLEAEVKQAADRVQELEIRVQTLESHIAGKTED